MENLPGLPIVNLNGAARESLVRERREAMDVLRTALERLCRMRPHGRDFQTAPPGAYEIARAHHETRIRVIAAMIEDLQAEAIELYQGGES